MGCLDTLAQLGDLIGQKGVPIHVIIIRGGKAPALALFFLRIVGIKSGERAVVKLSFQTGWAIGRFMQPTCLSAVSQDQLQAMGSMTCPFERAQRRLAFPYPDL